MDFWMIGFYKYWIYGLLYNDNRAKNYGSLSITYEFLGSFNIKLTLIRQVYPVFCCFILLYGNVSICYCLVIEGFRYLLFYQF